MKKTFIIDFILNGILGVCFLITAEYVYLRLTPASNFFKYISLTPVKEEFLTNEKPTFTTKSVYYKANDMKWNDILYCFDEGKLILVDTQSSEANHFIPKRGLGVISEIDWIYKGALPSFKTECYIKSNITMVLDFQVKKVAEVETTKFKINQ